MIQVNYKPSQEFKYSQISNYQFEFALLGTENQLLHTATPCKDYFQDIFWCENNQKSSEVHGMHWKPGMLDISAPTFRIILMGGAVEMKSRIPGMQEFVNHFDNAQGFPLSVFDETENEKHIVVTFSREWTRNGPLLSAFTSLLRISGTCQPGEEPIAYLKRIMSEDSSKYPKYMAKEVGRLRDYKNKLAAVLKGIRVEKEPAWGKGVNIYEVHNLGIVSYVDFPTAEFE